MKSPFWILSEISHCESSFSCRVELGAGWGEVAVGVGEAGEKEGSGEGNGKAGEVSGKAGGATGVGEAVTTDNEGCGVPKGT